MRFADHFSTQARTYAARRPRYPDALFAWLAAQAPARQRAWDAGCGSGQASLGLAAHFATVIASDPSAAQIAEAPAHPRIDYRVEPAEAPSLDPASVDLVSVAQALHWFDQDAFHAAVRRVLRPGGLIAAWTYALCRVDAAVDAAYDRLYEPILGPYWPAERRHVESGYRELPFPWEPVPAPQFDLRVRWNLEAYRGYLGSWSATQRYIDRHGADPRTLVDAELAAAWGDPAVEREVVFPLALRVGRAARSGG
jgi:SAM-dependent methyltransferase